jgi:predicted anti-sigma-YlaC factor YlaD
MSLKHLTDEEIQEYLDGNLSPENALSFKTHLEICPLCRESLNQYHNLYADLSTDKGFELSKDFAKSVTSKLPAMANVPSRPNYVNTFVTVLSSIIGMALIFYYVGLKPLSEAISHTLSSQFEFGSILMASMKNLLVSLNGNISFWVLAGLTFLVIVALDHVLFHPKFGRISF